MKIALLYFIIFIKRKEIQQEDYIVMTAKKFWRMDGQFPSVCVRPSVVKFGKSNFKAFTL